MPECRAVRDGSRTQAACAMINCIAMTEPDTVARVCMADTKPPVCEECTLVPVNIPVREVDAVLPVHTSMRLKVSESA